MDMEKDKTEPAFLIRTAVPHDVDGIMRVMETAKELTKQGWFVSDNREYVEMHIAQNGFIVVAEERSGEIAGFFMVDFPGQSAKNLGYYLGLEGKKLEEVVHMDSTAVLPKYRGNHLQYRMMCKAEEMLDERKRYRYRMSTVHPDNCYSFHNLQKRGYLVLTTVEKYGGLLRHVMYKEIR